MSFSLCQQKLCEENEKKPSERREPWFHSSHPRSPARSARTPRRPGRMEAGLSATRLCVTSVGPSGSGRGRRNKTKIPICEKNIKSKQTGFGLRPRLNHWVRFRNIWVWLGKKGSNSLKGRNTPRNVIYHVYNLALNSEYLNYSEL